MLLGICFIFSWCAGLCRTSEIFGVSEIVLDNVKILGDVQFQSLSVTAEKWITVTEVIISS